MCRDTEADKVTVNVADPAATSYQLEGLAPHSSYVVTVAARTNTVGQPQRLEIKTDTAPPKTPPRSIIADSPTPTTVDLSWQAPACLDTNGDITEYEYELVGVDDWATQERQTSSVRESKVNVS